MLRLRQVCLVARELAPVEAALCDVFDLKVCHRDPAVGAYGLENILLPIGDNFLEIVPPSVRERPPGAISTVAAVMAATSSSCNATIPGSGGAGWPPSAYASSTRSRETTFSAPN